MGGNEVDHGSLDEMARLCEVGVVGEWREMAEDSRKWRSIMVKARQKLGTVGPYPL